MQKIQAKVQKPIQKNEAKSLRALSWKSYNIMRRKRKKSNINIAIFERNNLI